MNFKTTIILAVIFGAMVGYNFFDAKSSQQKMTKEEQEKKVFNFTSDKVTSFNYTNKKENLDSEFINKKGTWYLAKPVSYKADNTNVNQIIDNISNAKFDQKIEDSKKLEDFGLKEPQITLSLNTNEGKKIFKVGDKSPTNSQLYIMKDNDPNIYLVSDSVYIPLDKKLYDLRDKTIMEISTDKVSSINLKNIKGNFILKKANNIWNIESPQKYKADISKVNEIINRVKNDKITDFLDDNPDSLAKYGLDKPEITVAFSGNDKTEEKIIISKETGGHNFAKLSDSQNIFQINNTTATPYNVDLNDLRDKNILSFNSSKINKVEIDSVEGKIVSQRDKNQKWNLIQNRDKNKLSQSDIETFINRLSNLNFVRAIPNDKFSLGDQIINVTLTGEAMKKPIKLSFGGVTADNKSEVYLLNPETNEGFTVDKSIINKISVK